MGKVINKIQSVNVLGNNVLIVMVGRGTLHTGKHTIVFAICTKYTEDTLKR